MLQHLRRLSQPARPDGGAHEVFVVPTDDHWLLALHHYVPSKPKVALPILMVHGIAANRRHFDLSETLSLARFAASRGFDVYVLELRGSGMSRPMPLHPRALRGYGFADFAQRDLPEAVHFVLARSGAKSLHGVGHSMGGMVLFAAGTEAGHEFASITSVGTPLVGHLQLGLGARERRLMQLVTTLSPAARFTPPSQRKLPLRRMLATAGLLGPLPSRLGDNLIFNSANIDPDSVITLAKEGIHDVPMQLVTEITTHLRQSGPTAAVGPYAYEAQLGRITAPILAISGSADRIAPPQTVSAAVARIIGSDVRYREMGTRFGDRVEYCHIDLMVGRHAPHEVYPQIMHFIEEVDAA